jgi:hypothetical protein
MKIVVSWQNLMISKTVYLQGTEYSVTYHGIWITKFIYDDGRAKATKK